MKMEFLKKLRINSFLLFALLILLSVGLLNLYSAVYDWEESSRLSIFWSQLVWVGVGLGVMFLTAIVDRSHFERGAVWFYGLILFLLLCVVFFGVVVNGTKGWLKIGPFTIQPAEFAKISFVLVAARYFGNNPYPDGMSLSDLWKPFLWMFFPFVLIILQGDLGTSIFLILLFVTMTLFSGVKKRSLIMICIAVVLGSIIFSLFFLKDYQRSRLTNFINPEADIKGSGYQVVQSKIAVGSGRFVGKGYLKGNINKLRYLPERHTDFIFPVLAEEWGFAGSIIVIILYATILLSGVEIAKRARDRFSIFLALGVTSIMFWQVAVNLMGVLGLMPLTGVPLPFMSYGGSSMIALLFSIGILLNVDRNRFRF